MVAAVVIAVPGAVAAAHLVAVGADAAGTAFDQSLEQPLAGFGAAAGSTWCCRWRPGRRPANSSSETMRGQSIGIHSARSRGTCRVRRVGRRSGTDSVRL